MQLELTIGTLEPGAYFGKTPPPLLSPLTLEVSFRSHGSHIRARGCVCVAGVRAAHRGSGVDTV